MVGSRLERAIERTRLLVNSNTLPASLSTLIFGLFIALVDDAKTHQELRDMLWSGRPAVILLLICILILILVFPVRRLLERHRIARGDSAHLSRLLVTHVDPIIRPYAAGEVAMRSALTLQLAPDLTKGWLLRDIEVASSVDTFAVPTNLLGAYKTYFKENEQKKRFFDDGEKFCLVHNPACSTDSPTLSLKFETAKYSQVRFYCENIANGGRLHQGLIREAIESGSIAFPNSFCMHCVVVTKDGKLLVTKRPPPHKTDYHPNAWSVSLEEQLHVDDQVKPGIEGFMLRWAKRFLREELAVPEENYEESNLRALSIFLEADILNCAIAAVFRLSITSGELDQMIRAHPRPDTEFQEWRFATEEELAKELFQNRLHWHPTSQYRILLFLYHKWGAPKLADFLVHAQP